MRFFRKERVGSVMQRELSALIQEEMEFNGALVTITIVDVARDLSRALVKITVLPTEKSSEALKKLQNSQRHLQFLLLRKMNIKPMPRIAFEIDHGPERAAGVEKSLLEDHTISNEGRVAKW